jgi:hypothetical protein
MGGMGPGGMMGGGPGGMMSPNDQPPNYTSMPQMPPRYSSPNAPNPYANYPASPRSSSSSATGPPEPRTRRRSPGAAERIPMGAYAKSAHSPRIKRSHTEPTTADRLNRNAGSGGKVGPTGKEWIPGDAFLDACTCTANCTCRQGHRVLYRSKDESPYGGSDTDAQYRQGEIRYIMKKDLGRDCGDHSGCKSKKADSDDEGKMSKKEQKKEEKKRKEQFEGFKEDMLEALDVRFEALKKERSKAGSVRSSPRQTFAGFGEQPFGMGAQMPGAMGQMPPAMNPLMTQQLGGGGMAMGGGVPPGMPMNMGINPYATGLSGGMTRIPGMGVNPMGGGRRMRPGQMPGTIFDGEMSMSDRERVDHGSLYSTAGMKAGGIHPRYTSPPGRQGPGDMHMDERAYYTRKVGHSILKLPGRGPVPRGRGRAQRPRGFDVGSHDSDLSPRQQGGRRVNGTRRARFDETTGKLKSKILYVLARSYFQTGVGFDNLDREDSPRRPYPRRGDSTPTRPTPKHQAAYESDDDGI